MDSLIWAKFGDKARTTIETRTCAAQVCYRAEDVKTWKKRRAGSDIQSNKTRMKMKVETSLVVAFIREKTKGHSWPPGARHNKSDKEANHRLPLITSSYHKGGPAWACHGKTKQPSKDVFMHNFDISDIKAFDTIRLLHACARPFHFYTALRSNSPESGKALSQHFMN
jgi:hypothetical protein